jgi:hypothetical protein
MSNKEAFEVWYCGTYWNFNAEHYAAPRVTFDKEKSKYSHIDVQMAWNAWNAGKLDISKRSGVNA